MGCTNHNGESGHLSKDITDKNRFRCRVRRSLRGTNFEYTASISHDLLTEQISVHKKKLHKQSCTKPHSNVDFKKSCKLVAISFHFFLYLLVFFGSFEAEADIDIVWLELIVEVNNWIERLFMEIALI